MMISRFCGAAIRSASWLVVNLGKEQVLPARVLALQAADPHQELNIGHRALGYGGPGGLGVRDQLVEELDRQLAALAVEVDLRRPARVARDELVGRLERGQKGRVGAWIVGAELGRRPYQRQ